MGAPAGQHYSVGYLLSTLEATGMSQSPGLLHVLVMPFAGLCPGGTSPMWSSDPLHQCGAVGACLVLRTHRLLQTMQLWGERRDLRVKGTDCGLGKLELENWCSCKRAGDTGVPGCWKCKARSAQSVETMAMGTVMWISEEIPTWSFLKITVLNETPPRY